MSPIIIASILGSLISLDITLLNNIMISRPIVAGPVIGYFLGDMKTGIEIGVLFEMLWSDVINVGASVPINLTMLTALVLGSKAMLPHHGNTLTMFIIILAIPIVYICRQIDIIMRSINSKVIRLADKHIEDDRLGYFYFSMLYSLGMFVVVNYILLAIFIPVISKLSKTLFFYLSLEIIYTLKIAYTLLPILGFAVLFNNFFQKSFKSMLHHTDKA
ncbi:PTS sugar transporter subunit IIC [bacterium]